MAGPHKSQFLPGSYASVRVKNPSHRHRALKLVLLDLSFIEVETEARLCRERKICVDHTHRREAEPPLPDLLLLAQYHAAADLLHGEVGHRSVDMNCGEAADRAFARVGRHLDTGSIGQRGHLPQRRDSADM